MTEMVSERFERLSGVIEVDLMTRHFYGAGMKIKRMELPAGHFAIKHVHDYDHWSILSEGRALVITDEGEAEYRAGDCILIKAGLHHEIRAIEDIMWFCIHHGVKDIDSVGVGHG